MREDLLSFPWGGEAMTRPGLNLLIMAFVVPQKFSFLLEYQESIFHQPMEWNMKNFVLVCNFYHGWMHFWNKSLSPRMKTEIFCPDFRWIVEIDFMRLAFHT